MEALADQSAHTDAEAGEPPLLTVRDLRTHLLKPASFLLSAGAVGGDFADWSTAERAVGALVPRPTP